MRRSSRRSARISYAEPPANLKDIISSTGNSNHGDIDDDTDYVRPRKRVKKQLSDSKKEFDWHDYISEETLNHMNKTVLPLIPRDQNEQVDDLMKNWHYQFVAAWLNNVCESYVTIVLNSIKPLWKNIKFDEILFLQDYCKIYNNMNSTADNNYVQEEPKPEQVNDTVTDTPVENLFTTIQSRLFKQVTNSKNSIIEEWDERIIELLKNYYPEHAYEGKFCNLPMVGQFKTLYYIIKMIESRSMVFKNYLANHVDIFQFTEFYKDENTTILVLPNHGSIVERVKTIPNNKDSYFVPIKLQNCTIKRSLEGHEEIKELIHLDYSMEIDSYLNDISIEYNVKSYDWATFIDYVSKCEEDLEDIKDFIEIKMAHLLYAAKLINQRAKAKSMELLLTRRKRSSRLQAKEEEIKEKEVEDGLFDKVDERDHFLKSRHRNIVKYNKKMKDILWSTLWFNFEQDFKILKPKYKKESKYIENDEKITQLDNEIITSGINFIPKIIPLNKEPMTVNELDKPQEIPTRLCLNENDLMRASKLGVELHGITKPDNKNWIFDCNCNLDPNDPVIVQNDEQVKSMEQIFNRTLVCCDICHIWQHWDCQLPIVIDILSQMHVNKKDQIKHLTQRDFATVLLGTNHNHTDRTRHDHDHDVGSRRSARLSAIESESATKISDPQDEKEEKKETLVDTFMMRPTDKRVPYGSCTPFICGFCMYRLEGDLRGIFVPELEAIRLKQRKGYDDRERRKMLKLEKKKRMEVQDQMLPGADAKLPSGPTRDAGSISAQDSVTSIANPSSIIAIPPDNVQTKGISAAGPIPAPTAPESQLQTGVATASAPTHPLPTLATFSTGSTALDRDGLDHHGIGPSGDNTNAEGPR